MPLRVKKNTPGEETLESAAVINWYEQLRAYAIAPCKTFSTSLGLDLWIKKGFKGWMKILVSHKSEYINKKILPDIGREVILPNSAIPTEFQKELTLLITNLILSRR